jgi:SAM-dependent methyltransferase
MSTPEKSDRIELEFSEKYNPPHAQRYLNKHRHGLARRLSHWREEQVNRRALAMADDPDLVLDLPCGAGRFWRVLCERPNRVIMAADNSKDMLATALAEQPPEIVARVHGFQTSAFAIDLGANAVDCIFCIRLLHHIESGEHRLAILREFHRVSRDTLIVSLWVDGNYKAWRRRRDDVKRVAQGHAPRRQRDRVLVARDVIESEFSQTGWRIIGHIDFVPAYAMWRTYVLRKAA